MSDLELQPVPVMADADPLESDGAAASEVGSDGPAGADGPAGSDGPAGAEADAPPSVDPRAAADASLLVLVDRLSMLFGESNLLELEIEAGDTSLVLRAPGALLQAAATVATPAAETATSAGSATSGSGAASTTFAAVGDGSARPASAASATQSAAAGARSRETAPPAAGAPAPDRTATHVGRLVVAAPLTGVWYSSSSPGTQPFVQVGGEIAVGQVIGLIEAMKLFNEIKSDRAGRVARIVPDNGALVRAKQPLLEVEPL